MTYELTVYMKAAWRHDEQLGPPRYSATMVGDYGTPNFETFWEAVGELIRSHAWYTSKAA